MKKNNTTAIILAILLVLALIISIVINSNHSTTIKRMSTNALDMQSLLQAMQDTLTAKEADLETANAAVAEAQTTIDTLTADYDALNGVVETLQAEALEAKNTIDTLTADNATLNGTLETLQAEALEAQNTIASLTEQLAAKEAAPAEETALTAEQIVDTLKGITGITNAIADGETVTFGIGAIPACGTLTVENGAPVITFHADVPESQQAILTERINAAFAG